MAGAFHTLSSQAGCTTFHCKHFQLLPSPPGPFIHLLFPHWDIMLGRMGKGMTWQHGHDADRKEPSKHRAVNMDCLHRWAAAMPS